MNTKPALQSDLSAALRTLGFKGQKATWNRHAGEFIDVIDLQVSKSGDRVTMNAGVLYKPVYLKAWSRDVPAFVSAPDTVAPVRLGELIDGRDHWWPLEVNTGRQLVDLALTHVMPFVDGLHSVQALEEHLSRSAEIQWSYPLPKIYLALLMHERGDAAGACALLAETAARTESTGWRDRVAEISAGLNCA